MDQKRKEEIAWVLFKRMCGKNGVPQGNNLKRLAGNVSQLIKVEKEKVICVYMGACEELFYDVFSKDLLVSPEKMKFYGITSDVISGLSYDERNQIALKILKEEIKRERLVLEKSRFSKGIENMASDTNISQEELLSFWGEIYGEYF